MLRVSESLYVCWSDTDPPGRRIVVLTDGCRMGHLNVLEKDVPAFIKALETLIYEKHNKNFAGE